MTKRGTVNFIHWSDSHLGFYRFGKTDAAGINQRMLDFHGAFSKSVDLIIKAKPDFTIHSGDLFESYHPPNRSRDIAIDGLERLSKAGIPTVILSGTHDVPKIKRDTHVFDSVTRHQLNNIYMVKTPDKIDLSFGDERVAIYCVPYSPNFDEMKAWFVDTVSEPKDEDVFNMLVLHCDIAGAFKIGYGANLIELPNNIESLFDYVALGHLHSPMEFDGKKNVIFAGATERKDFGEAGEQRFIHSVSLSDKDLNITKIPIENRPMECIYIDLKEHKDPKQAETQVKKELKKRVEEGGMYRVTLKVTFDVYKGMDIRGLMNNTDALYLDFNRENVTDNADGSSEVTLNVAGNIVDEWRSQINATSEDKEDKKWLYLKGKELLEEELNRKAGV